MATVKVYDQTNKAVGDIELSPDVFGIEVKPEVMNLVVRSIRAAKRAGTHCVKTRSMVRGGGRKPWRQKGTGRARAGSVRSPLWVGGATTFGPQPRDYSFKVNRKVRRLALKMALSSRAGDDNLKVVKELSIDEIKTKKFAEIVKALGLRKALIVLDGTDNTLALSARNLPFIKVVEADKLNVYDVLKYPELVLVEKAALSMQERLK